MISKIKGYLFIVGAKLPRGERRSGASLNRETEGNSVQWDDKTESRGFSNNFGGFVRSGINDYFFSHRNLTVAELIEVEMFFRHCIFLNFFSSCF